MSKESSPKKPTIRARSRSKSETRKSISGISIHPIEAEHEKRIKQMESHFNPKWELGVSLDDVKSLINNVEGHQRDQGERTKWQTTVLLNYLKFINAGGGEKFQIIEHLEQLLNDQPPEGYRTVIISLLARFNLEVNSNEDAVRYMKEYGKLESTIIGNISDHPEVMASHAFALAFCSPKSTEGVVELYQRALEERPEEVDWLFGLCLALEKRLRIPTNKDDTNAVKNLEKILRRVICIDPTHYQAKLVLSKRLIMKEAFEEADDLIKEVEGKTIETDVEESATKLEMLGALYQRGIMSKLCKTHLDIALNKFQGALSLRPQSEKAIHGYSRCLLLKYLNAKNKKKDISLEDAKRTIESLKNSTFAPHILTQAQIYSETALLKGDLDMFKETEATYEKLIEKEKDKKENVLMLCESYWNYSIFLQKHGKNQKNDELLKKEIFILEQCVETDRSGPHNYACGPAIRAQNQLLDYATLEFRDKSGKHMSLVKAFEVKSLIYSTDEDYDTAIFYIKKAIEEDKKSKSGRSLSQIERLISLLLDASKKSGDSHLLVEAKQLVDKLDEGESKNMLNHEVIKLGIGQLMTHAKLENLKERALEFEALTLNSADKSELIRSALDVFADSKSALDYSMHWIKDRAYPNEPKIKNLYFPYKDKSRAKIVEAFEKKLKFPQFGTTYPKIVDYVEQKVQPEWIEEFIGLRNKNAHEDPNQSEMSKMSKEDRETLTRNAYNLAAENFNFIASRVPQDDCVTETSNDLEALSIE